MQEANQLYTQIQASHLKFSHLSKINYFDKRKTKQFFYFAELKAKI